MPLGRAAAPALPARAVLPVPADAALLSSGPRGVLRHFSPSLCWTLWTSRATSPLWAAQGPQTPQRRESPCAYTRCRYLQQGLALAGVQQIRTRVLKRTGDAAPAAARVRIGPHAALPASLFLVPLLPTASSCWRRLQCEGGGFLIVSQYIQQISVFCGILLWL